MNNITAEFISSYPVDDWEELGLFSKSDLGIINEHWMTFPPPRPGQHLVLALVYFLITLVGVGSNLIVILLMTRKKHLLTPPNILVLNLSISDMFMAMKSPIFIVNSLWYGPVLGEIGCQIYGFVGGLTGTTSIMSMAILAGNRYRVISKPFDPDRKSTKIQSMVQILFIWLYALCFASLPLFGISRYVPEGYLTSCSFEYLSDNMKDRIFILIFFIGAWCVPFSLISFSYINIVSVIRRSDFKVSENVDDNIYRKKTEMKITKTIFILIGLWMIAWTPYAIVALLGISGNKEYVTPFSSMLPGVFCKLSACANPFLYALSHPGMKKEIVNIISNCCLSSSAETIHLDFIKGKTNCSSSESNSSSPSKEKADFTQDRTNKNANEIHPIKNSRIS